ncbi:hypothetical protein [Celeribacter sp.]|uniref:hypothetical protein n=1 Tax=Celeribacter sp. TaxID=1890673 RepID=UPI003A8E4D81
MSEPFGGCYEALDIEVGEDGTLFATPAGIATPSTYVFRGGTAIETSQDIAPREHSSAENAASNYPFHGDWTCADSETKDVLTELSMTSNDVSISFMGTRIDYERVNPIGRNGTAFNVALRDGQMGSIYELSDHHFLLNFSGLSLSCER